MKLGPEAFDYYVSLGPARSYQAVATKFHVTKRTVTMRAAKDRWQEQLGELEQKARRTAEEKGAETIESINERHLRTVRAIMAKAIQSLKEMPMKSALDAVRSLDLAIRQERLITGLMADAKETIESHDTPEERNGLKEMPMWLVTIVLRPHHFGDRADPGDVFVSRLFEDIEAWLHDLAEKRLVDKHQSFQDILLEALEVEPDPRRLAEMKSRILRLDQELAPYREGEPEAREDDPIGVAAELIRRPSDAKKNHDIVS